MRVGVWGPIGKGVSKMAHFRFGEEFAPVEESRVVEKHVTEEKLQARIGSKVDLTYNAPHLHKYSKLPHISIILIHSIRQLS